MWVLAAEPYGYVAQLRPYQGAKLIVSKISVSKISLPTNSNVFSVKS